MLGTVLLCVGFLDLFPVVLYSGLGLKVQYKANLYQVPYLFYLFIHYNFTVKYLYSHNFHLFQALLRMVTFTWDSWYSGWSPPLSRRM